MNVGTKDNLMQYRGWDIYWTGWKPEFTTAKSYPNHRHPNYNECYICGKPVLEGSKIKLDWMTDRQTHWTCEHPDGRPGQMWSQWIAARHPTGRDAKFVYTCCSPVPSEKLPGGRFQRGQTFEIPDGFVHVTELTSEHDKAYAVICGLVKMFELLDAEANDELENPVRFCHCRQCGWDDDER